MFLALLVRNQNKNNQNASKVIRQSRRRAGSSLKHLKVNLRGYTQVSTSPVLGLLAELCVGLSMDFPNYPKCIRVGLRSFSWKVKGM